MSASARTSPATNWLSRFHELGAIWEATDPDAPHVKTSLAGSHVDRYFNSDAVLSWPDITEEIVRTILQPQLAQRRLRPDWVVGYAPFGLFLAQAAARALHARCAYTDPSAKYDTYFQIQSGDSILVVADDMYTGGSVLKTISQLERRGATVLPIIFCLVNLSGKKALAEREILAAGEMAANTYRADECQMCRHGSTALTPRPNWHVLLPAATHQGARADRGVPRAR